MRRDVVTPHIQEGGMLNMLQILSCTQKTRNTSHPRGWAMTIEWLGHDYRGRPPLPFCGSSLILV